MDLHPTSSRLCRAHTKLIQPMQKAARLISSVRVTGIFEMRLFHFLMIIVPGVIAIPLIAIGISSGNKGRYDCAIFFVLGFMLLGMVLSIIGTIIIWGVNSVAFALPQIFITTVASGIFGVFSYAKIIKNKTGPKHNKNF